MKYLNYKYILGFMLVLSTLSCSDFLEDEIQYTSQREVVTFRIQSRGLINSIYSNYSFNYFDDFSTENLTDNSVSSSGPSDLATSSWSVIENPFGYRWQQSYNNIRQIAQYIELVHEKGLPYKPSPEDSLENVRTIARYYGEAHFLKAFAEWKLLKIFGGPSPSGEMLGFPIVNGILETNEDYNNLTRDSYDACVDQIMSDLDVAIDNLPLKYNGSESNNPGYSSQQVGRASGLAAYALKAKVALFAASPAFNPNNDLSKWEAAAQYANDAIVQDGGLFDLQSYDFSNEDNPDHIWRLRNGRNNNNLEQRLYPPSLYGNGEVNPSQNLVDAFPSSNGYPISSSQSNYDPEQPYANRDARFYNFIFYNGDQCFNSPDCNEFNALEIYPGGADYFGGFIQNIGTRTGYYQKKFLNNLEFDPSVNNAVTNRPKVYVQLGRTELYLQYAEAVNEAYGQPETVPAGLDFSAKEVLAKIRLRAGFFPDPYLDGMSADQGDFRTLIRNERRVELSFTGERFHDLRRWKEIENIQNIRAVKISPSTGGSFSYQQEEVEPRVYAPKNYYLPIPYDETLINKNLIQNQGW